MCAPISAPRCIAVRWSSGELGYLKKEIALIGDAMNTAARILEACRETGCAVLASATLLERLTGLPPGVAARALGPLPMRGKERALELYALEPASLGRLSRRPFRRGAKFQPRSLSAAVEERQ